MSIRLSTPDSRETRNGDNLTPRHTPKDGSTGVTKPEHKYTSTHLHAAKRARRQFTTAKSNNPLNQPARSLSRLENLPTEILEVIFLYSVQFNRTGCFFGLPRASLAIGKRLSSDYIRKRIVFLACWQESHPKPLNHDDRNPKFVEERTKAQNWILKQPWLTTEFVAQCAMDFIVTTLVQKMGKRKLHFLAENAPLVNTESEPIIRAHIKNLKDSFLTKRMKRVCDSNASIIPQARNNCSCYTWTEGPPQSRKRITLILSIQSGAIRLYERKYHGRKLASDYSRFWQLLHLQPKTQLPNRLLHRPWTPAKLDLLEVLIRFGASVDWLHSTGGEVAESGFQDAIIENNLRAIVLLSTCKDPTHCPSHAVGIVPTQKHLLLAMQHGCDVPLLKALLLADGSKYDLHDVELVRSIHEMWAKGFTESADFLAQKRHEDQLRRVRPLNG